MSQGKRRDRTKPGRRVELLAPAGSMEAFRGALNAGADAVYLAGQKFGARAYADNFSEEELEEVLLRAHLFGMRIYLTVNTLTRQSELSELAEFVQRLSAKGLDGVIVQDLGVAASLRRACPQVELHASTQMSVTGPEAVRFLKKQGFVRVVPARELSLEEIRLLKQEDIEVESFIHGAMCYSYSGRCLLSGFLGGRSGNRGRCAGPCRLPYEILDESGNPAGGDGQCYPISMRDMCVLPILPELIDCGIDSFKIEGRMKKPEYVAGTTAIYRKYIDRFYVWDRKGRPGKWKVDREDLELLNQLYIRTDLCTGYYHERNGRDMVTIHEPGYRGAREETLEKIRKTYLQQERKLPVTAEAGLCANETAWMHVAAGGAEFTAEGEVVQEARSRALQEEEIRAKLSKSGDVPLEIRELEVYTDGKAFLPVSALGDLRRKALGGLLWELSKPQREERNDQSFPPLENQTQRGDAPAERKEKILPRELFMVRTASQAEEVLSWRARDKHPVSSALILDGEVLEKPDRILSMAKEQKCPVYAALPYILRDSDRAWLELFFAEQKENFYGFVTRNLEELEFLQEKEYDKTVLADSMLYVWNNESEQLLRTYCDGMILTQELDRREMASTFQNSMTDKILTVYGRVPMMLTANCVRKTQERCRRQCTESESTRTEENGSFWYLQDRKGARFPVCVQCSHCQNIIYNSVPTSLHGFAKDALMQSVGAVLLSFTTESAAKLRSTLELFSQSGILEGTEASSADAGAATTEPGRTNRIPEYTTGHYRKGTI